MDIEKVKELLRKAIERIEFADDEWGGNEQPIDEAYGFIYEALELLSKE